jgi:phosphoribosylformimino-5-aminoimidazole carboxamide ribotide isomerase
MMVIYPAIDIKDGECVRLIQGDLNKATTYYSDPVVAAEKWESLGADCIHVVDLNGAVEGKLYNMGAVRAILAKVKIPVQLGGGIRNLNTIADLLSAGVEWVVLGTAALEDKNLVKAAIGEFGSRIVIGIDARDGYVAIEGWKKLSSVKAMDFARNMEELGVKRVIYTDISRDGMLKGPNIESIGRMIENTGVEVIASGGISSNDDLVELKKIGVYGAIVGKALYSGKVDLKEAIRILGEEDKCLREG